MALSHYVSYAASTTGTQSSVNLDPSITPFEVNVAVYLVSTGTYSVQYTLDPIDTADSACRWFDDSVLAPGTTTSGTTSYRAPITKVRLVIVANAGGIEFKTLQGFTTN